MLLFSFVNYVFSFVMLCILIVIGIVRSRTKATELFFI